MSDLKRFQELVDDIWELVFGTVRRPEVKFKGMMTKEKIGEWEEPEQHDFSYPITEYAKNKKSKSKKRKRARKADGTFRGDDKSTPDVNEAWED